MDTFAIKDQEMTEESFRAALLRHDAYNRKIYEYVRDEAVTAPKSFILSPFTDEANVEKVVEKVLEARAKVAV